MATGVPTSRSPTMTQGRTVDLPEPVGEVELGNGLAAADVTRHRRAPDHLADTRHYRFVVAIEVLGEPAPQRWLDQRLHALLRRCLDPLLPDRQRFRRNPAGRVAEHQAAQASGIRDREAHPDHPAHRQADKMRPFDAQCVEQRTQVVREQVERVRSGRRIAATVAAGVETQHPETLRELRGLLVPHGQITGQRMAHHHPGTLALYAVVDVDAVCPCFHGPPPDWLAV